MVVCQIFHVLGHLYSAYTVYPLVIVACKGGFYHCGLLVCRKYNITSVKIIKNEVGCRDDTVPKTVDTRRHCEED